MRTSPHPRRGFTLLELLVVIAVVGILTALLLPALTRAKGTSKRMTCLNNLKQINYALRMYADDSGDILPRTPSIGFIDSSTNLICWTGYKPLIKNYVGTGAANTNLFACPADTFFYRIPGARGNRGRYVPESLHAQADYDNLSYGFNGASLEARGGGWFSGDLSVAGQKLSFIKNPARTILAAEMSAFYPWSWHDPQPQPGAWPYAFNNAKNIVSFADGHAGYLGIYYTNLAHNGFAPAYMYSPPPGYDYQWRNN